MFQLQVSIGETFPVSLVLLSNGTLVWIKTTQFKPIYDSPSEPDSIAAVFSEDGFTIGDDEYSYNRIYEYKELPSMLKWLKQQQMQEPEVLFKF